MHILFTLALVGCGDSPSGTSDSIDDPIPGPSDDPTDPPGPDPTDTPSPTDSPPPSGEDCLLTFAIDVAPPVLVADNGPLGADRMPWALPIFIDANQPVELSVPAPFEVFDTAGELVDRADPGTELFIRATAPGAGSVSASIDGCPGEVTVDVSAIPAQRFGARLGVADAFVETVSLTNTGEAVGLHLDPSRFAHRTGETFTAWVIPHRTAEGWTTDPNFAALEAVSSVEGTVGDGLVSAPLTLWASPETDGDLATAYDILIDFDGDRTLDPGDVLQGGDVPALTVLGDLLAPGPHDVSSDDWTASYWITQRVYWPTDIDTMDARPLFVISHGNGHDYDWYDYLGNHLASWGYIVMSHRNDTVPGTETAAVTTGNNTEALLADPSPVGGGVLVDKIDGDRIAWVGHSRGGEGVVIAYDALADGIVAPPSYTADDIRFVGSIAPVIFQDPLDQSNPHDVPYYNISGSMDGDVTGGVAFGDDVQYYRIFTNATGERLVTYVHGADHNDFNCCGFEDADWTDGAAEPVCGRPAAQAVAKAYFLALAETYLGERPGLLDLFRRDPAIFRPDGVTPVLAGQFRDATSANVIEIDDFQSEPTVELSSSGGAVTTTAADLVEDQLDDGNSVFSWNESDPMNGMTWSSNDTNADRGIVFTFDEGVPVTMTWELIDGDVSGMRALSMRVAQGTRHPNTQELGGPLSFAVVLVDSDGSEVLVDTTPIAGAPHPFPRFGDGSGQGWANEFQTFSIPLEAFSFGHPELDLSQLTTLRLEFGIVGSVQGRVALDDLFFTF